MDGVTMATDIDISTAQGFPDIITGHPLAPSGTVKSSHGCQVYVLIMRLIVITCMITMGSLGNMLTICVLWAERNKSSTMFLLLCLAMADTLLLLVYAVIALPSAYTSFLGFKFQAISIQVETMVNFSPSGATSIMISMGLTVAVTWQRYVSVCMPYKVKTFGSLRVARLQAVTVVAFSVLFNLPRWFEYTSAYDTPIPGVARLVATDLYKNQVYQIVYGIILYYLMFYILPMSALAYMTISLIRALKQAQAKRSEMVSSASSRSSNKEDITKSLIVVVIVFIVCQFFGPARRIMLVLYPNSRQCGGALFYFEAWSLGATITNSAVNFIIYILCARRFRKRVKAFLLCSNKKVSPGVEDTGQSNSTVPIHSIP